METQTDIGAHEATAATVAAAQHPLAALHSAPFDDNTKQTWSIVWRDAAWSVATDGRMLLAVQGATDLSSPDEKWLVRLVSILALEPVAGGPELLTSAEALREWAGDVVVPPMVPCEDCGGSGRWECPTCDFQHPCVGCGSTGKVRQRKDDRPGLIVGVCVDLDRLSRLTSLVAGPCKVETVTNTLPKDGATTTLRLLGEGWVGFLATMTPNADMRK